MVGDPRAKSIDVPSVLRQGIDPEPFRMPDWSSPAGDGTHREWSNPFKDIPRSWSRTPGLPSWFEDPSQPGLPPSLQYVPPGGNSPGFPPIPAPVPEPSTIPQSQLHEWLLHYLRNTLSDQRHLQQTPRLVLNKAVRSGGFDPSMGPVASAWAQQTNQEHPGQASPIGPNEEPSQQQTRFLRSRLEYL